MVTPQQKSDETPEAAGLNENIASETLSQASDESVEALMDAALQQAKASMEQPLAEKLKALEEENAKLRDQWVRAVAETDNVRKRAQRDQEEYSKYAVSGFARDLISVLENLKRATESIPLDARQQNELLKTLGEGVDLTLQELLGIFDRYGIKRIDPLHEKFDHNLHQAVVQVEQNDVPPGTVIQVVQAGYIIHDRLLQPAMVAVSKQGDTQQKVDTTA